MAKHTAAEMLVAIDIVAEMPDTGRLRSVLRTMRERLERRAEHDRAIGAAFVARRPDEATYEEWGALIREAVEATGATITEPPRADEPAAEEGTDRD